MMYSVTALALVVAAVRAQEIIFCGSQPYYASQVLESAYAGVRCSTDTMLPISIRATTASSAR